MPAQHLVRAHQQPNLAQHVARQSVQQGRQERVVSPVEPRLLLAQLAFQHGDLMAQGKDSTSLSRLLIGSRRSTANAFVTPSAVTTNLRRSVEGVHRLRQVVASDLISHATPLRQHPASSSLELIVIDRLPTAL
jgi:hypothetical protein